MTPHELAMMILDILEPGDYEKEELIAKFNMSLKLMDLHPTDSEKCLRTAISTKRKNGLKLETIRQAGKIIYRKKGLL